jgi:sulfur-carrier protein
MSVSVRVPTILRTYTDGASEVTVDVADDATLSDVLAALEAAHPGIAARVLDDNGALRRFVNVYVGDEDVRFVEGLATPVGPGGSVSIIPAVAGGVKVAAGECGRTARSVRCRVRLAPFGTSGAIHAVVARPPHSRGRCTCLRAR